MKKKLMPLVRQIKLSVKVSRMSRLATILGHEDHRPLEQVLEALHTTLDSNAHDVTILGDLAQKTAALKRDLKLDHTDTTAYELYVSLRQRVVDDNVRLARSLAITHENAVSEATPRIVRAVSNAYADARCFVAKSSVLKKIIKLHAPKHVMKALHYRSVDSMLKHESPSHIVVLARYLETPAWHEKYNSELAKLTAQDFEMRPLEVVWLDKLTLIEPLQNSRAKHHLVLHAKEAGCVAVAPAADQVVYGYTIRTLVLLEHYAHEILYLTSYAKAISPSVNFGTDYVAALGHDHESHIQLSQYPLHWRSMHHAVAHSPIRDILPPHLSVDRWHADHANDRLQHYNNLISFWQGYGHLVTTDDQPVSASLIDLAIDGSYGKSFDERSLKYARRALEQELFSKYLQEPRISRLVLHRLNLN